MVPVSLTSPDFMSFASDGLVLLAVGAHLVPGLPSICPIAAIWLAALATTAYLFSLAAEAEQSRGRRRSAAALTASCRRGPRRLSHRRPHRR